MRLHSRAEPPTWRKVAGQRGQLPWRLDRHQEGRCTRGGQQLGVQVLPGCTLPVALWWRCPRHGALHARAGQAENGQVQPG